MKVFLSYCHKDDRIADQVDRELAVAVKDFLGASFNVMILRDIRDVGYTVSFRKFMEKVRETDFVLMLISDSYLKSENCMKEVIDVMKDADYEKRILPILLEDAVGVFKTGSEIRYVEYWKRKSDDLEKKLGMIPETSKGELGKDLGKFHEIRDGIAGFIRDIRGRRVCTLQELREANYDPVVSKFYFKDLIDEISKELDGNVRLELERILAMGDLQDQLSALDLLGLRFGQNASYHFLYGAIAEYKEVKKIARREYEEAIEIDPKHDVAHFQLAQLLEFEFHDYVEARKHYEKSLKIEPSDALYHSSFGYLLKEHFQDYRAAIEHYEKAIRIDPTNAKWHYTVADILDSQFKKYKQARRHYEEATRIDPNVSIIHFSLASLLEKHSKDYATALAHYKEAARLEPDDSIYHFSIATILEDHFKDYGAARKHYERALEINPNDALYHSIFALFLEGCFRDFRGAREHYEKALEIDPADNITIFLLTVLLEEHFQDYEEGGKLFEKALKNDPDDDVFHFRLGRLLERTLEDFKGARKHYEEAVRINPDDPELHYSLARLLEEHFGDHKGAEKHYRIAREIRRKMKSRRIVHSRKANGKKPRESTKRRRK